MDISFLYSLCVFSELNLAAAAHMSDRITDEVIESLSRCYKGLVSYFLFLVNIVSFKKHFQSFFPLILVQAGDNGGRKRASTPDVLRSRSHISSDSSRQDLAEAFLDSLSPQMDESPLVRFQFYNNLFTVQLSVLEAIKLLPGFVSTISNMYFLYSVLLLAFVLFLFSLSKKLAYHFCLNL